MKLQYIIPSLIWLCVCVACADGTKSEQGTEAATTEVAGEGKALGNDNDTMALQNTSSIDNVETKQENGNVEVTDEDVNDLRMQNLAKDAAKLGDIFCKCNNRASEESKLSCKEKVDAAIKQIAKNLKEHEVKALQDSYATVRDACN